MKLWLDLWQDEWGSLVSAELIAISTLTVGGLTVGLNSVSQAVNAELKDFARSIRRLDQQGAFYGQPLAPEGEDFDTFPAPTAFGAQSAEEELAFVVPQPARNQQERPADPDLAAEFEPSVMDAAD